MRLLVIADPLAGFKIHKDSTYVMLREAARRGYEIHTALADDLRVSRGHVEITAQPFTFSATQEYKHWFVSGEAVRARLSEFDAVIMRKDPPFDQQYLYNTHLLSLAETQGARVFNPGQTLRDYNEKLAILKHPEFTIDTLVTQRDDDLRAFLADQHDIILKPLDGMGGMGIFRLRREDPNIGSIIETLTDNGRRTIMAQRYLPAIKDGDKRILLIDGKPVDWCLARIPKEGETRGNLAVGGTGVARPLSGHDREIAEALGPKLAAQGLLLVGLDVIGKHVTEINVTSPTCFREISDQSGIDVGALFIDALERRVAG
ncbi:MULTISPECIES: glutathione synthase [Jeongeupia]|uniref:Glutathione synthetase n=2 Tax=Jeongeupia TaxID=885864 RepID=A0ABS2BRK7_9NEIS|nr:MULTISPECIES: glutathione synthase [Jeongeupia]MBM3117439.1 glutathione synthase [Jeongeupia naejangsanensis]GHD67603.1 glutathione synthetase [Jeongeupia chitinilytica]